MKAAGDITHGQLWVQADHFRDLEGVAGVGQAHDLSGDIMMVHLPSMTLELSLLPLCFLVPTGTNAWFKCGETLLTC